MSWLRNNSTGVYEPSGDEINFIRNDSIFDLLKTFVKSEKTRKGKCKVPAEEGSGKRGNKWEFKPEIQAMALDIGKMGFFLIVTKYYRF